MRIALGAALLIALATPGLGRDEKKKEPDPGPDLVQPAKTENSGLEAALHANLKDVINRGVDLYNAGDIAGCYRLFEGSLRTVRPLLAHRKELAAEISEKLAAAEKDPTTWRRAFTLRSALDKVRTELKPRPATKPEEPEKKPDDKKPDDKKPEDKKPDDKKPDDKKPDDPEGKGDAPPLLKKPRELKEVDD